jgi:PAS fold
MTMAAAKIATFDWNMIRNEVYWSPNLESLLGMAPGEFAGTLEAFQRLLHPEDRSRVQLAVQDSAAAGASYEVEFPHVSSRRKYSLGAGRLLFGPDRNDCAAGHD